MNRARSFPPVALALALVAAAAPAHAKPSAPPAAKAAALAPIPAHPNQLAYADLVFDAPARSAHRREIPGGVVAFVVEDHALPLVTVALTFRAGSAHDPAGKEGLASLMAGEARRGGAGARTAEQLDEEADFLAVDLSSGSGARESTASVNVLTKDLDAGLDILMDVVRRPRYQQDRLDLAKSKLLQDLERRNDSTTAIEAREWRRLAYGDGHFETAQPTSTSVGSITRDDLVAFHAKHWHPGNLLVAVSGDVKPEDVTARLARRFEGWTRGEAAPKPPAPTHRPPPGVYLVNKDDVNQTRVAAGHLATTWNDPNARALEVMNEILGAGGFTSRITRRVRDDEGLAYSAGSGLGFGRDYPMTFRAGFQSKNASVARALTIMVKEIERIRVEPVSDEELSVAAQGLIESFPSQFSSAGARAAIFVQDELWGRPDDWWKSFRPQVAAVTKEDVQRVAKEYLHPDALAILVVGKIEEVLAGDPDYPDDRLADRAGPAGLLEIPLPNPSTLAYPHGPRPRAAKPAGAPTGM